MILLTDTTHSLQIVTSSTATIHYQASYVDITTSTFTPLSTQGTITTATTTSFIATPAASTQRQVKNISIKNTSTTSNSTVEMIKTVSAVDYELSPTVVLLPGEALIYSENDGWKVYTGVGEKKTSSEKKSAVSSYLVPLTKTGTAMAIGVPYSFMKDTGYPGAITLGTPGVNGNVWSASVAVGHLPFVVPTSGSNYIRSVNLTSTVAGSLQLFDLLWFNTGLVVTTTTAQTFTTPTLPARDQNSTTDGVGVLAALLVTATNTGAAANSSISIQYTNSSGVSGRSATISRVLPAASAIGTFIWFSLQTGDVGIRSIQSVTLVASLAAGSISILLARPLTYTPIPLANLVTETKLPENAPLFIGSQAAVYVLAVPTATTAVTIQGNLLVSQL